MNKKSRKELKRLAEAATPGPWEYQKDSKDFPVNGYVTVRDCIFSVCVLPYEGIRTDDRVTDNGLFIAAANPAAIQSLLAYVDRLEAQRDRLLIALSALHDTACKCDGWESFPSTALDAASAAITEAESQT